MNDHWMFWRIRKLRYNRLFPLCHVCFYQFRLTLFCFEYSILQLLFSVWSSSYHDCYHIIIIIINIMGASVSAVGWGTMLQARMTQSWFPIKPLDFFNWPNSSIRTMALGLTQLLTEMSTRNLPAGGGGGGGAIWHLGKGKTQTPKFKRFFIKSG
jgi:hypothetical protein